MFTLSLTHQKNICSHEMMTRIRSNLRQRENRRQHRKTSGFQGTDPRSACSTPSPLWPITTPRFVITRGAAARIRIHTSRGPKTCRPPALKINKRTRSRLKIETANSQRALAAVEGVTAFKFHIFVEQRTTSGWGEMIHSSCFPFMTGPMCVKPQTPAVMR